MSRFLERWSRLKRQGGDAPAAAPAPLVVAPTPEAAEPAAAPIRPDADAPLPPVDSLDLGADFTAFMKEEVSDALRRAALRKLFADPHFHFERMDKLDIYIDDYSTSAPIPQDVLQSLRQFETLLKDDEEKGAEGGEQPRLADDVATAGAAASGEMAPAPGPDEPAGVAVGGEDDSPRP